LREAAVKRKYSEVLTGIVFACLIFCLQPAAAIVGGASLTDGSPRYHVVFIQDSRNNSCTGTALTRELVLTAAQCVDPDRKYKIVSADGNRLSIPINVTRVEIHPNFNAQAYSQSRASVDLALLELATPLPLAIPAPSLGYFVAAGDQITVIGYGVTEKTNKIGIGVLRAARLNVTGNPGLLQIWLVDPTAGGVRAGLGGCDGDSGAPAIHVSGGQLVGIVVWATGPGDSVGCGGLTGLIPIKPYTDWILATARKLGNPIGNERQDSQTVSSAMSVPMQMEGGTYFVPVLINNAITLDFVVDSGAADVSIPADVVLTLMRTGTLKESDFLGQKTYVLADGSKVPSQTFRIRSLKVGNKVLENVNGSVASVQGSLLLGQSFLGRFKSWSVDNAKHALVLE
jgi:secreted trypsin-like serine protease